MKAPCNIWKLAYSNQKCVIWYISNGKFILISFKFNISQKRCANVQSLQQYCIKNWNTFKAIRWKKWSVYQKWLSWKNCQSFMKQKTPQKICMKTFMKDDTYIEKFHVKFHERSWCWTHLKMKVRSKNFTAKSLKISTWDIWRCWTLDLLDLTKSISSKCPTSWEIKREFKLISGAWMLKALSNTSWKSCKVSCKW